MAIVHQKAQVINLRLPDDVIAYVANSFPSNIRELEGALNKLSAYRMLTGCDVDEAQAQVLLGRRFNPKQLSKEGILDSIAHYFHLQRADLQGPLRSKHIAFARQVAVYIVRELTEDSFPQIGNLFGGRRHTTILYAYEKMKELIAHDVTCRTQVHEIMEQVKAQALTHTN